MKTQIVQVPYDSGHKGYRMGKGPKNILRHLKAEENFAVDGVEVQDRVAFGIPCPNEMLKASLFSSPLMSSSAASEPVYVLSDSPSSLGVTTFLPTAFSSGWILWLQSKEFNGGNAGAGHGPMASRVTWHRW